MKADMTNCTLCPRACGADRTRKVGRCGGGALPRVARAAAHFWEEPCISGSRGSGTVFFSGCSLGCVFCQNEEISQKNFGTELTVRQLADLFSRLEQSGVHNLNLVTAGHFLPQVLEALALAGPSVPVVYNTSSYETVEAIRSCEGLVDVFLPDLKFFGEEAGMLYAKAPDYFDTAAAAIGEMLRQTGEPVFDEDGLLVRGTLIRHLILPGQTKNARRILDHIAACWPSAMVSVMSQYLPMGKAADYPPLDRKLTPREIGRVEDHFLQLGLAGFVQERTAADRSFVPDFDLTGVTPGSGR